MQNKSWGFAVVQMPVQRAGGRVVGGHELANAGRPSLRRPQAGRPGDRMPAVPEARLEVQGTELIETQHPGTCRWMGVQVRFFLVSNSGSGDDFQVLWWVKRTPVNQGTRRSDGVVRAFRSRLACRSRQ
jgi:hypothetical protein